MNASRLAVPANPCGHLSIRALLGRIQVPTIRNESLRLGILSGFLANALVSTTSAAGVNVSWAANPEPDVSNYQVHYGSAPGSYGNVIDTGASTSAAISGLTEGTTYYFAIKAVNTAGLASDPSDEVAYTVPGDPPPPPQVMPRAGWVVRDVNSEESAEMSAEMAFDGDPSTMWHTAWSPSSVPHPHWIEVDIGGSTEIRGFRYLPRAAGFTVGNIASYELLTSLDGVNWAAAASGVFPTGSSEKEVFFTARPVRYFRFRALSEVSGLSYTSLPEFNLILGDGAVVPPSNNAPVASGQTLTTQEDTPLAITLAATDVENSPLAYTVVSQPSKGVLSGTPPNLTYTPNANLNGSDSFTFRANDGALDSNAATVSLTIQAVNDAPVASGQSVATTGGTPVAIVLAATDVEGSPLTYTVVAQPSKGVLSGAAPNLTYTPNAGAGGADSFTFRANDGALNSNVATVNVTIHATNTAPVAVAKSVSTNEDTAVAIALSATDVDLDPLTYTVVAQPSKGVLSGSPPNLTYTPNANVNGSDSFTFRANDGTANSNVATVGIAIAAVNDAPVAAAAAVGTTAETAVSITLSATDVEGSPLTYTVVAQPAHGTLSGSPPNLTYTPAAGYDGADSFTFRASDGTANSNTATVSITVSAAGSPQDAFVLDRAGWSVVSVDSQEAPNWAAAKAIDGNPSSFWHTRFTSGATAPPHELVIDLGAELILHGFRYLPRQDGMSVGNISDYEFQTSRNGSAWSDAAAGAFAADSSRKEVLFTARAARYIRLRALGEVNGNLHTNVAELDVLGITGANRPPTAVPASGSTATGGPITITLAGGDPDMQPLSFGIVRKPRNGTLSGSGDTYVYQPDAGFNGADSFTYRAGDGLAFSDAVEVTLTVAGSAEAPKFRSKPILGRSGTSGASYSGASLQTELASTGSGKNVTFHKVSGPSWLKVSASGNLSGKPSKSDAGTQSFTVRATNSDGVSTDNSLLIELSGAAGDKLPSGWSVDAPGGAEGVAKTAKGKTVVSGTGELSGRSDEGYFASKKLKGDGSITVRLSDVRGAGTLARAGVMIRGSDKAKSPHVFLGTNAKGSLRIARRSKTGGATAEKASGGKPERTVWLRLVRKGGKVTAYTSGNGRKWKKQAAYKVKLGGNCRIGLWVSGGGKATGKATFKKLKIQS